MTNRIISLSTLCVAMSFAVSLHSQRADLTCRIDRLNCKHSTRISYTSTDHQRSQAEENVDLVYTTLSIEIDPSVRYIKGQALHRFTPKSGEVNQVSFDLHDDYHVEAVYYHNQNVDYVHQDHRLTVKLSDMLSPSIMDSLTILYEGVPPDPGAVGVFFRETESKIPIAWSLAEPYFSRDWWPCKQSLQDKVDSIDINITTPARFRAVSNGLLTGVDSTSVAGKRIYQWKHRYPIETYLVCFAVSEYEVLEDEVVLENGARLPYVDFMLPDQSPDEVWVSSRYVKDALSLFGSYFGTYPFAKEKYGHAYFGSYFDVAVAGLEHQTMTFMDDHQDVLILIHELAHQWFGNFVTCNSWHDIWLNEGFATYLMLFYLELINPPTEPNHWYQPRDEFLLELMYACIEESGGSVYVENAADPEKIFDSRLTYFKAAMLLHMIRWRLGDDHFFKAINQYLYDPDQAHEYAETKDLQDALEQVSGQDFNEFFDDWFYGEGHPTYHLKWHQNKTGELHLQIHQTTSHPSVDFYEMPIPVQVRGNLAEHDTILRLDHQASGQTFSIQIPFEVKEVEFDPQHWILADIAANTVEETSVTAVANYFQRGLLQAYPNPATDHVHLEYPSGRIEKVWISDLMGTRIFLSSGDADIDVSHLQPGIYLLSAWADGRWHTGKLIKQ